MVDVETSRPILVTLAGDSSPSQRAAMLDQREGRSLLGIDDGSEDGLTCS
jgi:hypothetical protein